MLVEDGIVSNLGTVLLIQKILSPLPYFDENSGCSAVLSAQNESVMRKFRTMTFACVYRSVGKDNGKNRLKCYC